MHGCTSWPHSKITILQKKEIIWTQESSGFWFVYSLLMNFPASPQLLPLVSVRLALFLSQVPSRSFKKSWTWQLNRTQQFPRVVFHSSSGEFPLARCVFHSSVESWKMIALESEFTPFPPPPPPPPEHTTVLLKHYPADGGNLTEAELPALAWRTRCTNAWVSALPSIRSCFKKLAFFFSSCSS